MRIKQLLIRLYPATCRGNRQAVGFPKGSQEGPFGRRPCTALAQAKPNQEKNTPQLAAGIFICVFFLTSFYAFSALAGYNHNYAIHTIQKRYQQIERNIKDYRVVTKTVTGLSAEGAQLQAYFKNNEIKKITRTYFGETGKQIDEYYFYNRRLIYVKATTLRYKKSFGKVATQTQNQYYFASNHLIRWLSGDNELVKYRTSEYVKKRKEILADARQLIKIARSLQKKVEVKNLNRN